VTLLEDLDAVEAAIQEDTVLNRSRSYPMPDSCAIVLYVRTRRLYRSTTLLLKEGFAEEAGIVARSLFTDSLRLGALADAPGTSLREERGLLATAVKFQLEEEPEPLERAIAERERRVERARVRFGVQGKHRAFPSDQNLATRQGRTGDMFLYRWTEEATHGSEPAAMFLRTRTEDDVLRHNLKGSPSELTDAVAVFAIRSALAGHRQAARILGLSANEAIESLWQRWSSE
jgi:hypothetical protein